MPKRSVGIKYYFLKEINPLIRLLIVADILIVGGTAMLAPIFALFIEGYIRGGNEQVAGIAVALFLITKSLFQIPIATMIDRIRGEKDDFVILVLFSLLMSLTPLLY